MHLILVRRENEYARVIEEGLGLEYLLNDVEEKFVVYIRIHMFVFLTCFFPLIVPIEYR